MARRRHLLGPGSDSPNPVFIALGLKARLGAVLDVLERSNRRLWLTVFGVVFLIYLSTAHWFGVVNIDTIGATWPGWELVHHGHLWLENDPKLPVIPWFGPGAHHHVVSNRMPGVILIGVPAQALLAFLHLSPLTPATLTAVVVTSVAMANMAVLFRGLGGSARSVLGCTTALAFGTGFWPNASAELWTHGPDALWLSLAMLALQRRRHWLAGIAMVGAVTTRPHLALAAAAIGLGCGLGLRQWRPIIRVGIPSVLGLAGLFAWNRWMFGSPSLQGGYTYATGRVTATSSAATHEFIQSGLGSLFSPLRGLLVYSPFVLLGALTAIRRPRNKPAWTNACLVGGVLYQLAQWHINGFSGGTGYYSYRLPLELLLLGAPAAYLGYLDVRDRVPRIVPAARLLVGASIAIQAVGVYWFKPLGRQGQDLDLWSTWGTGIASQARGTLGFAVAIVLTLAIMGLACLRLPPRHERIDDMQLASSHST